MNRSGSGFALVLLAALAALAASAAEPPAEHLTWQEANKRSAALVKKKDTIAQGTELARMAFELYPQQTKDYRAASHAQLLLNLVDARSKAQGTKVARDELERGIATIAQRAEPNDPLFVDLWRQGAAMSVGTRDGERYNERALAAAEQAWGPDDPRTIKVLLSGVHEQRQKRGRAWASSRFNSARERAAKSGEDTALVAEIDLLLGKLDLEAGRKDEAIKQFEALIARLEPRDVPEQEMTLLTTYALLEHTYEERGKRAAAEEIRQRRAERVERGELVLPGSATDPNALIPTFRVQPEYPREAARQGQSGLVEFVVRVNPDGTVAEATITRSEPAGVFDKTALRAIQKWKFKPKIVDGKAVEATGTQRIEFLLRQGP